MSKDEEKDVAWYSAIVQAWFATRIEKDRSLLTLSAGAIGLLVALFINLKIESLCLFILFIVATISFIVSLISLISIFGMNSRYLEDLKNGKETQNYNLENLDTVAYTSFILGIILTFIFAICVGANYISKKEVEQMSSQEKDKKNSPHQENENTKKSFQGANTMNPSEKKPNSKPSVTTNDDSQSNSNLETSSFQGANTMSPSEKKPNVEPDKTTNNNSAQPNPNNNAANGKNEKK